MMIERRCEIDHFLSIYEISTDKGLMVKVQTCGFATIFHEGFFWRSFKKNKSSKPGGDFFASPHQGFLTF